MNSANIRKEIGEILGMHYAWVVEIAASASALLISLPVVMIIGIITKYDYRPSQKRILVPDRGGGEI